MTTNQFAYLSRDLYMQIHVIESLVKSNALSEVDLRLSAAKQSYSHLQSLADAENKVQNHILANRKMEIHWLDTAVEVALAKVPKIRAKKRAAK